MAMPTRTGRLTTAPTWRSPQVRTQRAGLRPVKRPARLTGRRMWTR